MACIVDIGPGLYPWLRLKWRGPNHNNNGAIRFSVRQAADAMGVNRKTAARAFHDLQAKGFVVCTEPARLGLGGAETSPAYELTEIELPGSDKPGGRRLCKDWHPDRNYPVYHAAAQNPRGRNGTSRVAPMRMVQ